MARATKILSLSELPPGSMKAVEVKGTRILLANVDGKVFATSDICSHEEAYLSEGRLEGAAVVCPLHESEFDLETGEVRLPPAENPIPVYTVTVKGDEIFIDI